MSPKPPDGPPAPWTGPSPSSASPHDLETTVAGKYAGALVSELPRVNGWSIARHVGDRTPDKTQRLLNHARWDSVAAMGVVRRFAVAGLEEAARRGGRQGGLVIG